MPLRAQVWTRRCARVALVLGLVGCSGAPPETELVALVPDHLSPLFSPVVDLWHAAGGARVRVRYDAPARVARQVDSGTPAALVVTGDGSWMDRLQTGGHLTEDGRLAMALDELVVVERATARHRSSEPGPGGDGRQRLQLSSAAVVLPPVEHPPGAAAARLLDGVVRPRGASTRHEDLDENLLIERLRPGTATVVRESLLLGRSGDLLRFPVRGRLDLASTIELGALVGASPHAHDFVDFVRQDPAVTGHILALEMGMPNPRRQPGALPAGRDPSEPVPLRPVPPRPGGHGPHDADADDPTPPPPAPPAGQPPLPHPAGPPAQPVPAR